MVVVPTFRMGLALGGVVFHSHANDPIYGQYALNHERGHLAQEDLLGPLYIPIVGISSMIFAATNTYGWTEVWADGIR